MSKTLFTCAVLTFSTSALSQTLPQTKEALLTCLNSIKPKDIDTALYQKITASIEPDFSVLDKLNYQPEFKLPSWDYYSVLVDQERVNDGLVMMNQYKTVLDRIHQQYKVPPQVIVAIWGIESNYGKNIGQTPILNSLATLSCYGRRQNYFRTELTAALKIIASGDVRAEDLKGSWAGAFGNTQFMPSTYRRLAVDFDKDGKKDLVNSVPDALASTANFLIKSGWKPGLAWGLEVKLPQHFDTSQTAWNKRKTAKQWQDLGLKPYASRQSITQVFPEHTSLGLLLPDGPNGIALLVSQNFTAVYRYNASTNYALAILGLAQKLNLKTDFEKKWSRQGLSRKDRVQLQDHLKSLGYDIGSSDGILGSKSRHAIQALQQEWGMTADGVADKEFYQKLIHHSQATSSQE
ncbi:hypothetical protein IX83_04695 [Basilea psittacipulmonis DSM 24701]|uniref:Lytic transglycosylase n=1 Tax=Basilea psittacipulmonis DSM 24701 TaxID=1072685 RepID=A0A077DDK2_9BURK|nr:hypothetical protein IX83_04695 [Basilea psittacipulmonis DSM 24701]